jgi:hypothetical protein
MTQASERNIASGKQSDDAATRFNSANKDALHFMMGAQAVMLQEMAFVGYEAFDRTRTEMHLFAEFASKIAGAHSAGDIRTTWAECSRHQLDFVRRDSERLFKHGEQMIETASKLLGDRPQS